MLNPWTNPDSLPVSAALVMAQRFAERAQSPEQQVIYRALLQAANPQPGQRWLDAGCCLGTVSQLLAMQVGASGSVLGIDISSAMIAAARQQHPALHFLQADAADLPADLAPFDGATAIRLLLHVPDPLAVLRELRRVVRPAGRLALVEWDWGTLALDHPDRPLTRRIFDWRCDYLHGDNWIGRKLAGLCAASGWTVLDIQPLVTVARQPPSMLLDSVRHAAHEAQQAGIISAAEHAGWLTTLEHSFASGMGFASLNDYLVIAQ